MNFDYKFYLSLFLRRLHYFLFVAIIVSAAGAMVAYILPPVYRAEALLLVESPQIPGDLASSTVRVGAPEQLRIINQRLKTRASLLGIAKRLKIYTDRDDLTPDDIVRDMRRRASISLPDKGDVATFVRVSFDAPTAALSTKVTNELVTLMLAENIKLRTAVAGQTLDFFEQEVTRLTNELATQGAKITAFKLSNDGKLPDSLDYRRTRQAAMQERSLQIERAIARLNDRRDRFVDLYERTGAVDIPTTDTTPEQEMLRQMKLRLATGLALYAPENPKVKALKVEIAALEEIVKAQLDAQNPQAEGLSTYELQLADIDGQIEYLIEQQTAIKKELEELEVSLEATPSNAIALDVLERDYENIRMQYAQAADRLAQAVTGDRIEALSKGQRITVLEQATTPREPASPNRPAIAAGGIFAGIALGLGLIFLMEMMNRSIRRPVELTNKLGIAPLAVIPYIRTRRQVLRRRLIIGTLFLIAILGIPALLYALHTYYLPMDLLIERLLDRTGLSSVIDKFRQG